MTWREWVPVPPSVPEDERLGWARRRAIDTHKDTPLDRCMTPSLYRLSNGVWVVQVIGRPPTA